MSSSSPVIEKTQAGETGAATPSAAAEFFAADFACVQGAAQSASRRALRDLAWQHFERQGFPTLQQEEWRFTNVAPVAKTTFRRPAATDRKKLAAGVDQFRLAGTIELVFVDGRFDAALSATELPAGLMVTPAAGIAGTGDPGRADALLGSVAGIDTRPFAALSTALFEELAFVEVARGAVVEAPLHLLFYSTAQDTPGASFPRTLIHAGEQSQATIVESFAGDADAVYLTCPVTEIVADPAAVVDHYKFQRDSRAAFHLSGLALATARGASVSTHSFSLGGAIVRHDIQARLGGEGSEATLNGLYLVDGRQVCDTHMRVDHVAAHCASHELYKGILDGRSRAVFNGRIFVHKGAQKTDAKQTNRNLLLSDDALVNTNPQLEIFADDVKCTHGSTVGQLDDDAVFYLRSRGIGAEAAKSLLTYAFASDLVERAKVPALARELREFLFDWIPQGDVVRDAV
ncbi:MAG: Fe-S cluster assembly protein SufD [Acidobacteriota bacterium]|nr:Fe-S cluster assembly protein SufD [Acidobacteriota bacterium]